MKKHKKRKNSTTKKVMELIGLLGVIAGILAFFLDFFGVWDIGKKQPSIYSDEISVSYLRNADNRNDNIYQLFNDEIDDSKEFRLSESCATQIYITNHYQQEIVLNSIRFVAQNIYLIEEPVISLNAMEGNGYVDLTISNVGWRDSNDLELEFVGVDEDLSDYIKKDKLFLSVEGVKAGGKKTIRLWKNEDLITEKYSCVINFTANCQDVEDNKIQVDYALGNSQYLSFDINEGKLLPNGKGGSSDSLYGVCIDTSKSKFSYQDSIEEYIQPNETLTLPICFFPDRSCEMTFYVEFTAVYGSEELVIQSKPTTLVFEVLNVDNNGLYDATQYSKSELEKLVNNQVGNCLVSYPFSDERSVQNGNE